MPTQLAAVAEDVPLLSTIGYNVFSNLTKQEIMFLSGNYGPVPIGGRISGINLQNGCPSMCLGCGEDADRYDPEKQMSWENLSAILTGIKALAVEDGLDLIAENISFFRGSNPPNYHVIDDEGIERTIYDAMVLANDTLDSMNVNREIVFTTSGWTPGDNFMDESMRRLVDDCITRRLTHIAFYYSISPFGAQIRREYEQFFSELSGSDTQGIVDFRRSIASRIDSFFRSSKYVRHVIDNLRFSQYVIDAHITGYLGDLDDKSYPHNMPAENQKYDYLFSKQCVERLYQHCFAEANVFSAYRQPRKWRGIGRAVADLGVEPITDRAEVAKQYALASRDPKQEDPFWMLSQPFVMIEWDTSIHIRIQTSPNKLDMLEPSKEYFLTRAEHYGKHADVEPSERQRIAGLFTMYATLQGKKLVK